MLAPVNTIHRAEQILLPDRKLSTALGSRPSLPKSVIGSLTSSWTVTRARKNRTWVQCLSWKQSSSSAELPVEPVQLCQHQRQIHVAVWGPLSKGSLLPQLPPLPSLWAFPFLLPKCLAFPAKCWPFSSGLQRSKHLNYIQHVINTWTSIKRYIL